MILKRAILLLSAVCALSACDSDTPDHGATDWQNRSITPDEESFLLGNIAFTLFHEQGHALVSELDLPVLGREEDAVDRMATVFLAEDGDSENTEFLIQAMEGWFLSGDAMDEKSIACLLYGSSPKKFESVADEVDLPEDRRESCIEEFALAAQDFDTLIEPHILSDVEEQRSSIIVKYEPPEDYLLEEEILKESGLMEWVAEDLRENIRLKRSITINADKCGESNAFWDPETANLTICYELIRQFRELYHHRAG